MAPKDKVAMSNDSMDSGSGSDSEKESDNESNKSSESKKSSKNTGQDAATCPKFTDPLDEPYPYDTVCTADKKDGVAPPALWQGRLLPCLAREGQKSP